MPTKRRMESKSYSEFLRCGVGQIEPVLQAVEAQHALQADRWAPVAGPGVERLDQGAEFAPRHDLVHLGKELRPAGLLTVFVEAYAR